MARWQVISPAFTMVAMALAGTAAYMNRNGVLLVMAALLFVLAAGIQVTWLVRMYRQRRHGSVRTSEEP